MRTDEDTAAMIVGVFILTLLLGASFGACAAEVTGFERGKCAAIIEDAKTSSDTLRWLAKGCTP